MPSKDETLIDSLNDALAKSKEIDVSDMLMFNQDFLDSDLSSFAAANKNNKNSIIEQLNPLLDGIEVGPGQLKPKIFKGGVPGLQYHIKLN